MPALRRHEYLALLGIVAIAGTAAGQQPVPCGGNEAPPGAECRTIMVYEGRQEKSGRQIPIRFMVLRAERPSDQEPLFMLAGGPGQGSTELAGLANGGFKPVRATRDIVLIDQRGTGGSNPLLCEVDLVAQPALAFGHVFDPALFKRCRPELERHADLRFYTTEIAAEDIDQVRAALKYERVLVWGGSYGTRLAQAYMKAHPDRVRAAVLDGVVPFDFRAPAGYAASLEQSLNRVIEDCKASRACGPAHPDLRRAFDRLVARFRRGPIPATVRRPDSSTVSVAMSHGDFAYSVRGILYSAAGARALPEMIRRADSTGDVSAFAQRYWGRAADFRGFADGLHFAIFCAEDTGFIEDDDVPGLVRGTFTGSYLVDQYRKICEDWVRAPIGRKVLEPLRAPIPTLLLSGWFDPVTPPETAERVARELPVHRHLVVRNEAHGAGFGCARPATLHVLVRATLEGLPAVCGGVTNLWDK